MFSECNYQVLKMEILNVGYARHAIVDVTAKSFSSLFPRIKFHTTKFDSLFAITLPSIHFSN